MKNENDISDNLENEALPNQVEDGLFLSKIKKENNFNAPKNYFESLPEVMSNKNLGNKPLRFSFDKLSWRILIPFTAVIIIFVAITNLNTTEENDTLSYNQFSEYIITENDFEFEDEMVYEAYAELLENENLETNENSELENETEEYINYLIENDIDINSITEEL